MKKIYAILMLSIFALTVKAQMTGNFNDSIQFNSSMHNVAYYVPTSYNSANSYPLLVALHGCGGNAVSYRNSFVSIADSIGAILVCPDFMGGQISGSSGQIIPNVIDSTINQLGYNINTNEVYLSGFSCNGQESMKQGWNNVYPFKGIIPLNSWVPNLIGYNFSSTIPTCICSGTADGSYGRNQNLYDSLIANGGVGKFNSMPGIPHVSSFPTRDAELMECFRWFDSLSAPNAIVRIGKTNFTVNVYPNPANDVLNFSTNGNAPIDLEVKLIDVYGKVIKTTELLSNQSHSISTSELANGTYMIQFSNKDALVGQQKVMILR